MAINLPAFVVDAFTSTPFTGNPAAVCLLPNEQLVDDQLKQKIAAEFNLSETAFVIKCKPDDSFEKDHQFELRWFTIKSEIPICGHATLASAVVLFEVYGNQSPALHFKTKSGVLVAKKKNELISLDMPASKLTNIDLDESTAELIKITIGSLSFNDLQYDETRGTPRILLIRLSDSLTKTDLEKINPSFELMLKAHNSRDINLVFVTLRAQKNDHDAIFYDYYSCVFSPWWGVNEDPVTGSAHVILGSYWSRILNKKELIAYQCLKRGGSLWVSIQDGDRVEISGKAKIVLRDYFILLTSRQSCKNFAPGFLSDEFNNKCICGELIGMSVSLHY